MPIMVEKTLGLTQILEYLSLILDFVKQLVGSMRRRGKMPGSGIKTDSDSCQRNEDHGKNDPENCGLSEFHMSGYSCEKAIFCKFYRLTRTRDVTTDASIKKCALI